MERFMKQWKKGNRSTVTNYEAHSHWQDCWIGRVGCETGLMWNTLCLSLLAQWPFCVSDFDEVQLTRGLSVGVIYRDLGCPTNLNQAHTGSAVIAVPTTESHWWRLKKKYFQPNNRSLFPPSIFCSFHTLPSFLWGGWRELCVPL